MENAIAEAHLSVLACYAIGILSGLIPLCMRYVRLGSFPEWSRLRQTQIAILRFLSEATWVILRIVDLSNTDRRSHAGWSATTKHLACSTHTQVGLALAASIVVRFCIALAVTSEV